VQNRFHAKIMVVKKERANLVPRVRKNRKDGGQEGDCGTNRHREVWGWTTLHAAWVNENNGLVKNQGRGDASVENARKNKEMNHNQSGEKEDLSDRKTQLLKSVTKMSHMERGGHRGQVKEGRWTPGKKGFRGQQRQGRLGDLQITRAPFL